LEQSPNYSQRDLAGKLGMSLGKANYCLKGLINKGLVIPVKTTRKIVLFFETFA
jgi:DNA-binding MarR family transcriptional regulator